MTAPAWFHPLWRNRFAVDLPRIPMAVIVSLVACINSVLAAMQAIVYGRRIAATKIQHDPIFIIGHWRSGTTLLHELLVLDPRHSFPTTFECFCPNHFVLTGGLLPRMLGFLLPKQRSMDNMAFGWGRPQEDEFALCNMGIPSPYLTILFPNLPPQYPEYLDLEKVPAPELDRWKRGFLWFLQCLTLRRDKRIVLKSPPHTARIRVLLEMFPSARFVHIVRDPLVVFASTMNLWKRLYKDEGVQVPKYEGLEEHVFETLIRMYEAFERDRGRIDPSRYCEVCYEDLVEDPVGQMQRVYRQLGLDGFDEALPALQEYVAAHKDYKTNRFEIPEELRARIARRWAPFSQRYGYATTASPTVPQR